MNWLITLQSVQRDYPQAIDLLASEYEFMKYGDALPWLWTAMGNYGHGITTYRECLHLRVPDALANVSFFKEREVRLEEQKVHLTLNLASYNINTFRGKTGGMHLEEILLRHLDENHIGVVGIQETRRKQTKEWQRRDCFGFSSAARGGQGGIDIIFSKKIPMAWYEDKPVLAGLAQFSLQNHR